MATVAPLDSKISSVNGTSYASNAFVPTAGDLLFVFVAATGTADTAPTMTDSQSLGMTRVAASFTWATGTHTIYAFVSNALAAAASMTVTFDCSGDAATGCAIFVAGVQGMSRVGLNAIKQTAGQDNQITGTTPAPVFASSALTGNPTLGCIGNNTNPAGVTEPSGWTERADVGYTSPTTGAEYVSRDSGFTGTTITWGSTSASGFASFATELDASVPTTIVTPSPATLTVAAFAPTLKISIVPATVALVVTALAPALKSIVIPAIGSLSITSFQPVIVSGVIPAAVPLSISSFAPTLLESVTPTTASLTLTTFAPSPATVVIPGTASLTITMNAPSLASVVIPTTLSLSTTTFVPSVLPFNLVFLDPGGDAVQAVGRFNTEPAASTGDVTFDSTQQVVGVGSYKFDSTTDNPAFVEKTGVLGASRRVSAYFRYDSVPDASLTVSEFVSGAEAIYSGGGFAGNTAELNSDNGLYATAAPAQNAGQGSVFGSFGFGFIGFNTGILPPDAVIESVKIIYDRKYSTDTSIGTSRVKWRINGVEGPNHDNTDQPLTDTVVTVDVTADREWVRDDLLGGVFEVIAEARRGDTATSHTQSWDYIKVEVQYHPATVILRAMGASVPAFAISVTPSGSGVVPWFADGDLNGYQGITELAINTWHRISFSYVHHAVDDLDINIYVNGIQELSIVGAATNNTDFTKWEYGWVISPGVDHVCWIDQLYIDDGDDLSDPGNKLMTAKLPASVSDNEWNVTGGTGAVDERPLSETNHRKETRTGNFRQTYTLQTAAVGDVDISSETLVGYMGWVWAKMQSAGEDCSLVVNGNDIFTLALLTTSSLVKHPVTSSAYPSNAAGIGMLTDEDTGGVDVTLYECGAIVAYEGPVVPSALLDFQILAEDSTTGASDDMGSDPPASYELRSQTTDNVDAVVTTTIYSADEQGGSPQQQVIIESHGGDDTGLTTFNPGEEVTTSTHVTGEDADVDLRRSPNNE